MFIHLRDDSWIEHIERFSLDRDNAKRRPNGEYELKVPHDSDEDLDSNVNELLSDIACDTDNPVLEAVETDMGTAQARRHSASARKMAGVAIRVRWILPRCNSPERTSPVTR